MKKAVVIISTVLLLSVFAIAQSPKGATYITDGQVKAINALPGVDRQIVSVDIGKLNEAVGIIHRGPTTPPAGGRGAGTGAAAAPIPEAQACGEKTSTTPAGGFP